MNLMVEVTVGGGGEGEGGLWSGLPGSEELSQLKMIGGKFEQAKLAKFT